MFLTIDDRYESMPWDRLDSVVFDVGNVLVVFSPQELTDELFPGDPELGRRVREHVTSTPYWAMLDHGTLSYEEAVEAMTVRAPELREAVRHFLFNWMDLKHTVPEGIEALEAVKAHGKKAYVLSNYHDGAFAYLEQKYDFFRLFDGKLISSRVKLLKPDPAIFALMEKTFGLIPERTLFIDDTVLNVEAALNRGWQGYCHNRPGALRRFLGA
jgi:putative hydrolase of the HAD superfamily